MLVDTHAHLDLGHFDADREDVIQRASQAGVERIINVGIDPTSWRASLEISRRHSHIYVALGMHPHDALRLDDAALAELAGLCREDKVVAVGEIGLDYYRDRAPREVQREALRRQLSLARQMDLPIVIHDRDAHEDILEILREQGEVRGVMHCFSGDYALAQACLDLGLYISIPGSVTFSSNRSYREMVRQLSLARLVVETDSPFISPHPFRGKRNEPARVELVARAIADLKGESFELVAQVTSDNARTVFGLP